MGLICCGWGYDSTTVAVASKISQRINGIFIIIINITINQTLTYLNAKYFID